MFQCWVLGLQFKEELKESRCRIKLYGSSSSSSVTFEGPIISAEVHPSEVEKDGLGLIISSHMFKRILADDTFSVFVEVLHH